MSSELIDSKNFSNVEDFKWRHESVLLLCSLYKAKKEQFLSGFVKKRDLWAEVAAEMTSHGFVVNYTSCEKKWHNLCATFRKLNENGRFSAKKRKRWAYYQTFQEIFHSGIEMSLQPLNNTDCMQSESSCIETSAHDQMLLPQASMCRKSTWLSPSHHHKVEPMHPDNDHHGYEHDISSMLSINIEENLDHSQNVNCSNLRNGISGSHQLGPDDFKWNHNSVMLLCSLYIERKDQFQSGAVKKKDLWTDIAQVMNNDGYSVTCTVCEKKWHNLIATYKKVVLYNKKKTWPYLRIFRKIMEDQFVQPLPDGSEYGSLSNNYSKNIPNRFCEKITVKEDTSVFPHNEQAYYRNHFNRNVDTNDFKWTRESVISLCTMYKERQNDFQSNMVRKRDLWNDIARDLNAQGFPVTWAHCEKKWYNLYATYKKVTDQNRKRVRVWSTWPYLRFFQDIFDKRNVDQEQLPSSDPSCYEMNINIPSSDNTHYETETVVPPAICSPSPSNSEPTSDGLQDMTENCELPNKRQCMEAAPLWFLEYCERQRESEERNHHESERRHRELIDAITKGNQTLKDLTDTLKLYFNKCL